MVTLSVTSVWTFTVVSEVNTGGAGAPSGRKPSGPPPPKNTMHSTNAGSASANSLSQYWKAWTTVIARMPPAITLNVTTTITTMAPTQTGTGRSVASVSPAPCSCGTM